MTALADDRKTPDEPFLQRWARRKAEAATPDAGNEATEIETAAVGHAPPAPARDESEATEIDPATLPEIDSLDETSDFSIFMQDGVPEAMRTRALQRLWQVDPTFAHIDGLLEYGDDFTDAGVAAGAVSTIYKVGKGMLSGDDGEPEADSAVTAAEESADKEIAEPVPERDTAAAETPCDDPESPDDADKAG
jgi:Protein of unknown function (DUF3306)